MITAATIVRAIAVLLVGSFSTGTAVAEESLAAYAAEDGAVETARQCEVYVVGVAASTRAHPLSYRWLDDGVAVSGWQDVRADGSAPLELCGLSAGRHALTLEVTDGKRIASDTMTATIHGGERALVARGEDPAAR